MYIGNLSYRTDEVRLLFVAKHDVELVVKYDVALLQIRQFAFIVSLLCTYLSAATCYKVIAVRAADFTSLLVALTYTCCNQSCVFDAIFYAIAIAILQPMLAEACGRYGDVRHVKLVRDRETNETRGYAFITFFTEEGCAATCSGLNL
jgi:RNA recognition motif. (a.k.a. RRM, RBD, or RNP domain)